MSPSGYPDYPTSLPNNQGYNIDDNRRYTLLDRTPVVPRSLASISNAVLFTGMVDDKELDEIRRKREAALKEKMERQHGGGGVIPVDQLHISELLKKHPALVIDFWAEWCGPCRRVGPAIEELAQEFAGRVTFGKCNTDENQQLAMQLNISAIPNIVFFSHGKLVDRVIGAYPKEAIREKVLRNFP